MKNFKNSIIWLAVLPLVATGCLSRNYVEADPSITTDVASINVVSGGEITEQAFAIEQFPDVVLYTMSVKANRSWSATLPENADWVTLSEVEHINLSGATDNVTLVITFDRNKSVQARETTLTLSTGASSTVKKVIPIKQAGLVKTFQEPVVTATDGITKKDLSKIYPINDTCVVNVVCNGAWTAKLLESTTADAKLSADSGEDFGKLYVYFGENTDQSNSKSAVVEIATEGAESQIVTFTQAKGFPYISVPDSFEKTRDVLEREWTIPIVANNKWTAEIDAEQTTFANAKLSKTSGDQSVTSVKFTYLHGRNPEVANAKAVIHFRTEPNDEGAHQDFDLEFTQPGSLHLDILDFDMTNYENNGPSKPYKAYLSREFTYPSKTASNNASGMVSEVGVTTSTNNPSWGGTRRLFKTADVEFLVPVYGTKGFWLNSTGQGLLISGNANNDVVYIGAPALPGLTLKKVVFEPSWVYTAYNYQVTEASTERITVEGGKDWKGTGNSANDIKKRNFLEHVETHTFELSGTKPNTEYWLRTGTSSKVISVKEIAFMYE